MSIERRKAKRRPLLDAFSFFVVAPKKGLLKLMVVDLSDGGLGFDYDVGGEVFSTFPITKDETLDIHFYLNQTLFIPLTIKIVRIEDIAGIRRVGGEFIGKGLSAHKGVLSILEMIDQIGDVVQFHQ